MRSVIQDIRYALRTLRAAPAFAWAAALTLALGIGANTAIFSVINAVLLSPPNFRHLDRLAMLYGVNQKSSTVQRDLNFTPGDFLDWRGLSRSFDAMAAWRNWYYSLAGPEGGNDLPESVRGVRVSPAFFSMLGIDFALGRGFRSNEEVPGQDQVAVLASSLWKRHFGGDPSDTWHESSRRRPSAHDSGGAAGRFLFPAARSRTVDASDGGPGPPQPS
jgi:hypothetical protein